MNFIFILCFRFLISAVIMETSEDLCIFCQETLHDGQEIVCISQKGADGINEASSSRGSDVVANVGISVHVVCRKKFTSKFHIEKNKRQTADESIPRKSARLNEDAVRTDTHCLFCDTIVDISSKHKEKSEIVKVRTSVFLRIL